MLTYQFINNRWIYIVQYIVISVHISSSLAKLINYGYICRIFRIVINDFH